MKNVVRSTWAGVRTWRALQCVAGMVVCGYGQSAVGADHLVATQVATFDCGRVEPGDTVTLAAGNRGPLKITNCVGTAAMPIMVRNDASGRGPTVIQKSSGDAGGFVFHCSDCVHVVIDGSGKWVGASPGKTYGIKVSMTGGGSPTTFLHVSGLSRFVTIRAVEVDGAWPRIATNGIGIQVNDHGQKASDHPGLWREGIVIEGSYIHDVEGEALYIGPNWVDGDLPLRNVEIRYNVIEDAGWEGIQLKSAIGGNNLIHHNVVRRVGQRLGADSRAQLSGISLFEGTGRIFNNLVDDTGDSGIQHYMQHLPASYGGQVVEIYNNVVVGSGSGGLMQGHGVTVGSSSGAAPPIARVYSNTIVGPADNGIEIGSATQGGFVRDNIIADAGASAVSAPQSVSVTNNRIGAASTMAFVDAEARNFRLKAGSPARNAGTAEFPKFDFDDGARPKDGRADQGAFEYGSDVSNKQPSPPVIVSVQ